MKAWCKPDILFHHMKCVFCFRHRVMDLCLCVYFRAMSKNLWKSKSWKHKGTPPPKAPPAKRDSRTPTNFIPLKKGPKRCPFWEKRGTGIGGVFGESSPWIFLMQIQDANLKRPVVLKPGNSSGGKERASGTDCWTVGACIKVASGHQCIMVMEDSKKSFRDPGV